MTDAFEEVEEKLREERYLTLLKKYGPAAGVAIAAVLVGIGAYLAWDHYSTNAVRAHADRFAAAQRLSTDGDVAAAKAAFSELQGEGPQIYRTLTEMEIAGLLVQEGDLQGAIEAFDRAAEQATDPIVRDSARLRAAYLVADTQDFTALQARVEPLLESEGPLRAFAQELLAIEAWEAGDSARARELFESISLDLNAPESVRSRAEGRALAVLGPEALAPSPPAPASAPAAPATAP